MKGFQMHETIVNLEATGLYADGDGIIFTTPSGNRYRLKLTLDLVDALEQAHEELSSDLSPFIHEDMTIAEVAELFNDTSSAIIDTICSYTTRY